MTMAGLFGNLGRTDPTYVHVAVIVASVSVVAVIAGCAYLVVEGHPIAAGGLLLFGVISSLCGRE
jgi:hypothetical protein